MAKGDGTYIDEKGYPRMSAGPMRNIRVHTLVAMAKLGRPLKKDEVVHHLDGDKTNPHPDNIEVWDKSKHDAYTAKQYWFLRRMKEREEREWREFFATQEVSDADEDVPF